MRPDYGAQVASSHGLKRSPEWHRVEREHLVRQPHCVCCADAGGDTPEQVHHIIPFHFVVQLGRPDLELDQRNLITLCESEKDRPAQNHHLLVGHLDSFEAANLLADHDALGTYHGMLEDQIRTLASWQAEVKRRLRPWGEMTDHDKRALRQLMDHRMPKGR